MTKFRQTLKKFVIIRAIKDLPGIKSAYLFLVYRLMRRPFFSRRLTIRAAPALSFDIDYSFGLCGYDRFGDRHNSGFHRWLEDCRGKKIVFDVGAHIGLYSLPAGQIVSGQGRVFAFEPAAANVAMLQRHLGYSGLENVTVTQALVGVDSRQQVDFYEHDQADAMNAIEPLKDKERYSQVSRSQVCLDDFCDEKQIWPDIVKIDVEGAEVQVLKGAKDMLRKARPVVFLSVHPRRIELLGDTMEDLRAEVAAAGYEITDFNGQPATTLEFGEYLLVPHKV